MRTKSLVLGGTAGLAVYLLLTLVLITAYLPWTDRSGNGISDAEQFPLILTGHMGLIWLGFTLEGSTLGCAATEAVCLSWTAYDTEDAHMSSTESVLEEDQVGRCTEVTYEPTRSCLAPRKAAITGGAISIHVLIYIAIGVGLATLFERRATT